MSVFDSFLNGILNVILSIVSFLLTPFNALFLNLLPDFTNIIGAIDEFIIYITKYVQFILSWLNLPNNILSIFVLYYFTRITIYLTLNISKIIYGWIKGTLRFK